MKCNLQREKNQNDQGQMNVSGALQFTLRRYGPEQVSAKPPYYILTLVIIECVVQRERYPASAQRRRTLKVNLCFSN